jgi:hypothetical protein
LHLDKPLCLHGDPAGAIDVALARYLGLPMVGFQFDV